MPRVVAIIQARMSSVRLPRKVMLPLAGEPVLWHVVNRTRRIKGVDEVVVATSDELSDDAIEQWCSENLVECFRGSLDDVLGRYVACADKYGAQVVVRITADCPLLAPDTSSEVLAQFFVKRPALAGLSGEFPHGLDTQVIDYWALAEASEKATRESDREHVGLFIERQPDVFDVHPVVLFHGRSGDRWTLDEFDDYRFLKTLAGLAPTPLIDITPEEIFRLIDDHPYLRELNSHVRRTRGAHEGA